MQMTAWPQFAQVDPRDLEPARPPLLSTHARALDRARWREAGWMVSVLQGQSGRRLAERRPPGSLS